MQEVEVAQEVPKEKPEWAIREAEEYPDSSFHQFTKEETDDAFNRMISSIRKETEPKGESRVRQHYAEKDQLSDSDSFYAWGQSEPIATVESGYVVDEQQTTEREKFIAACKKGLPYMYVDNETIYSTDGSRLIVRNTNDYMRFAEEISARKIYRRTI